MKHIQYSKMNIQTKMIRFYFMLFVFALSRVGVNAQSSIREVLKIVNDCSFPYKEGKLAKRGPGCMLDNKNVIVPNRLYTNVQCTEYMLADDYDTMPTTYAKFRLPDAGHTLVALELGGNIDNLTDELILVDKNYNVTDALVTKVYAFPGTIVKQYYINEDGSIVVITLKPVSSASLSMLEFTQFIGQRIDETYKVVNGKFALVSTRKYKEKVYTYSQLSSKTYNLWDGNEQPVD